MSELSPIRSLPQVIDPLAPCPPGRYDDHLVSVLRAAPSRGGTADRRPVVRTDHFCFTERGHRIEVRHWLQPSELDNDLAGLLADELFAPGWLSGAEIFERVFTGVVRSCVPGAMPAWLTFYTNTMDRIRECREAPGQASQQGTPIGDFAAIYQRALRLIPPG